jgi:hypothetical protein
MVWAGLDGFGGGALGIVLKGGLGKFLEKLFILYHARSCKTL